MKHSRPEKKETTKGERGLGFPANQTRYNLGRNEAIDEYEKFLPSEGELLKIIRDNTTMIKNHDGIFTVIPVFEPEKMAKAISKRLGVGNEQS